MLRAATFLRSVPETGFYAAQIRGNEHNGGNPLGEVTAGAWVAQNYDPSAFVHSFTQDPTVVAYELRGDQSRQADQAILAAARRQRIAADLGLLAA